MSEDILSLKEVSSYLGAATDFYPNKSCKSLNIMVPGAGIEPARPYGQQILSLLRLPIPPSGRTMVFLYMIGLVNTAGLI